LENLISEQSQKLQDYSNRIEDIRETEGPSDEVVAQYEERISSLEEELKTLKESSGDFSSVIEEKNAIIEEQGRRLSQVKLEKTDKEIEFIKVKEQLEDYRNEIEKLNSSKNNYMLEANRSLEELEKQSKKFNDLKNTLEEKTAREEELNNTVEAQLEKIADLQILVEDLKKDRFSKEFDPSESFANNMNDAELTESDNENSSENNFMENATDENFEDKLNFESDELNLSLNSLEIKDEDPTDPVGENSFFENPSENEEEIILKGPSEQDNNLEFGKEKEEYINDTNMPKSDTFAHLLYGEVSVVSVSIARATMHIASEFKDYLNMLIEGNNTKIVIDLSECEFVDSTVLGVLVSSLKKAMGNNGDVRIVWGDNTESSMFYITRMDKVFKLFDNLQDAVQSYLD
jgi:anti-anti-sigma factor